MDATIETASVISRDDQHLRRGDDNAPSFKDGSGEAEQAQEDVGGNDVGREGETAVSNIEVDSRQKLTPADVPPATQPSAPALAELQRQLAVVRDRVASVALGLHTGFYLSGPQGTGKTHAVEKALEEHDTPYSYYGGHLTPMGLFDLLKEKHDEVLVLDDVGEILNHKVGVQLLLAALGTRACSERVVTYRRQGLESSVMFTGRLILISNLELHSAPLLQALKSRIHYLRYDPDQEQLASLMRDIAARRWSSQASTIAPQECTEVADHLIAESTRLGCRLDLRVLVDKAFPDYLQWKSGETECHWKDLVTVTLNGQLGVLQHDVTPVAARSVRKQAEQRIAQQIVTQYATPQERLAAWREQVPGKSERAFYRRCAESGLTL